METSFEYSGAGRGFGALGIVWLALILLLIVSMWKIFTKAGKPGWGSIVPIYNLILLIEIAGKPIWWIVFFFIPVVNAVIWILLAVGIAKSFGKGGGFAAGMIFLPVIFYPVLAFGSSTYSAAAQNPA